MSYSRANYFEFAISSGKSNRISYCVDRVLVIDFSTTCSVCYFIIAVYFEFIRLF